MASWFEQYFPNFGACPPRSWWRSGRVPARRRGHGQPPTAASRLPGWLLAALGARPGRLGRRSHGTEVPANAAVRSATVRQANQEASIEAMLS